MSNKIRFYHGTKPGRIKIVKLFFDRKLIDSIYDIDGNCIFKSGIIESFFYIPLSNGSMHDISLSDAIIPHGTTIPYINRKIKW